MRKENYIYLTNCEIAASLRTRYDILFYLNFKVGLMNQTPTGQNEF